MGGLLTAWLTAAAWGCAPVEPILEAGVDAVVGLDFTAAEAELREGMSRWSCGAVASPDSVARYWQLEAAIASLRGQADVASEAFATARAAAPWVWTERLGPALRAQWAAAPSPGSATVTVAGLPDGWGAWRDGAPLGAAPAWPAGPHLLQVGPSADRIAHSMRVDVFAGEGQRVRLPAAMSAPGRAVGEAGPSAVDDGPGSTLAFAVAAGVAIAHGAAAAGGDVSEPATKPTGALALGVRWRRGAPWLQLSAGGLGLLGGEWAYADDGAWAGTPIAATAAIGGGGRWRSVDLGAALGAAWPGRATARALAAIPIGQGPWGIALAAGANLPTSARPVEPATELSLTWRTP